MYNSTTEQKIKNIPGIGAIDIDRLPQELTKIYAQIVSLRRQLVDGTINFQNENLISSLNFLRKLANNLETILITNPNHDQKESIAFVAATANSLIHKMGLIGGQTNSLLSVDSISSYIAATVLFLIGNSQADAAETAFSIEDSNIENLTQQKLVSFIISLAIGKLTNVAYSSFNEDELLQAEYFEETALNYLWRELGLGIIDMGRRLIGQPLNENQNHFDKVISLSISEPNIFEYRSSFSGPYRLAKLLKILEEDIFNRAIIDIPTPSGVDRVLWQGFLDKLSQDRPYLWENHKEAVDTNFLNPGVSAVLTLPTGAGKSTLSELKIASCLYSGKKAIFLVPTHALEDQVNKNLRGLFAQFEPINIEFGAEFSDFDEFDSFPILVMTPERCLTFVSTNPTFFNDVGLVVFDEFHLIHGVDIKKDRRSIDAMYCLLTLFTIANHADFLLISAMVDNGDEIASWVSQITHRECKIFNSSWKPTRQLHGCLIFEEEKISKLNRELWILRQKSKAKSPSLKIRKEIAVDSLFFFSLKNIWDTDEDEDYFKTQILTEKVLLGIGDTWRLTTNRNVIAADLAVHFAKLGLKTLVFVDSPSFANSTSNSIRNALSTQSSNYDEFVNRNKTLIESLRSELGDVNASYFSNSANVGVHHGLLLPVERNLIESYFKSPEGSKVLVATATLAQGINLPAEIVIIAGDDRFDLDDDVRQRVKPYELLNAAGRAGRAGLSAQGAVILIPGVLVTIKESIVSKRWWALKDEVFSKGDQCLKIEDPLEYFLDTLQASVDKLTIEQTSILYRFRPENLSESDTKDLLSKSFYSYKATKLNEKEKFNFQVRRLLDRRNELDDSSEEKIWQKEIGVKMGLEPSLIIELDNEIESIGVEHLLSQSIIKLIEYFFQWLTNKKDLVRRIFTKQSTIDQIKKAVGLKPETELSMVISKLPVLKGILEAYVSGLPLNELNVLIPNVNRPDRSNYLVKARNFVNRLIPELSFGLGLFSMILVEKALLLGMKKESIPWNIRVLGSCIREGFDSAEKLFYKKDNRLMMRVETHIKFNNKK